MYVKYLCLSTVKIDILHYYPLSYFVLMVFSRSMEFDFGHILVKTEIGITNFRKQSVDRTRG